MDIYFACSITGGRREEQAYKIIVNTLLTEGHHVPTAHLSQSNVMDLERIINPQEVYNRDINWINSCHALIAEVSSPSHGVGYEIAYALEIGKSVLCCYQEGLPVSKMIIGNTHPCIRVQSYQYLPDLVDIIRNFLQEVPALTSTKNRTI